MHPVHSRFKKKNFMKSAVPFLNREQNSHKENCIIQAIFNNFKEVRTIPIILFLKTHE